MEPFDYYVSGIKINHQVPRFEKEAYENGEIQTFNLNDALEKSDYVALVFIEGILNKKACIKASPGPSLTLVYVSLEDISMIQKNGPKDALIVSDKTHQLSALYGVLDEHTHQIYNTVAVIKNTGQLSLLLSGLKDTYFEDDFPQKLLKTMQ